MRLKNGAIWFQLVKVRVTKYVLVDADLAIDPHAQDQRSLPKVEGGGRVGRCSR
jgi:hypothetical protein